MLFSQSWGEGEFFGASAEGYDKTLVPFILSSYTSTAKRRICVLVRKRRIIKDSIPEITDVYSTRTAFG